MRYLLLGMMALLMLGCGKTASKATLKVEELHFTEHPGGSKWIQGVVYNPGETPVAQAELEIALYDAHNRKVGTLRVVVRDIPPGGRTSFKTVVDEEADVRGARVRRILIM